MGKMSTHRSKAGRGIIIVWVVDAIVRRRWVLRCERGWSARSAVWSAHCRRAASRLDLVDVRKIGSAVASSAISEHAEDYGEEDED